MIFDPPCPPHLTELWAAIQLRPGMYFGEKSLSALYLFYIGFHSGFGFAKCDPETFPLPLPADFHDWVAYRTGFRESTSGWSNMIVETSPDEETALKRFFELLEEHHHRVPNFIARGTLPRDSASNDDTGVRLFSLVSYTDDRGFFLVRDPDVSARTHRFLPSLHWLLRFEGIDREDLQILDADAFQKLLDHDDPPW